MRDYRDKWYGVFVHLRVGERMSVGLETVDIVSQMQDIGDKLQIGSLAHIGLQKLVAHPWLAKERCDIRHFGVLLRAAVQMSSWRGDDMSEIYPRCVQAVIDLDPTAAFCRFPHDSLPLHDMMRLKWEKYSKELWFSEALNYVQAANPPATAWPMSDLVRASPLTHDIILRELARDPGRASEVYERREFGLRHDPTRCSMLHLAVTCLEPSLEVIDALLTAKPQLLWQSIDSTDATVDDAGCLPIHQARSADVAMALLAADESVIHAKDNKGRTFLHHACRTNNLELVKLALAQDPQALREADSDGELPLFYVAQQSSVELFSLVLSAWPQAAVHISSGGRRVIEKVLVHWSAEDSEHCLSMAQLLLGVDPSAASHPNDQGQLPLHFLLHSQLGLGSIARMYTEAVALMRLLIESSPGALQHADNLGNLPLHATVKSGQAFEPTLLDLIVQGWPEAALVRNNKGKLPVELAVAEAVRLRQSIRSQDDHWVKMHAEFREFVEGHRRAHAAACAAVERREQQRAADEMARRLLTEEEEEQQASAPQQPKKKKKKNRASASSARMPDPMPRPNAAAAVPIQVETDATAAGNAQDTAAAAAAVEAAAVVPAVQAAVFAAAATEEEQAQVAVIDLFASMTTIDPLDAASPSAEVVVSSTQGPSSTPPEPPDELCCPITTELMDDPVMATDGHTYERRAIEQWFATGKATSPKTGEALAMIAVFPNHSMRSMIREWQAANEV